MKKLLILFLIAFASYKANAMDPYSYDGRIQAYIRTDFKFMNNMDDDFSLLFGAEFGIIIYQQLAIGIGGWFYAPSSILVHDALPLYRDFLLHFSYGGIHLEYIFNPNKLYHFTVNCILGFGDSYVSTEYYTDLTTSKIKKYGTESFGIIEPGIQFEVNLFSWMKVALGGSYLYLYEFDNFYGYKKSDFEGLAGVLTLKFDINPKKNYY